MRIAWFSPLPPSPSGLADYSYELLPHVADRAMVDAFAPGRVRAPPGVRVRPPQAFRPDRYDAIVTHIGNDARIRFTYEAALRHGGVLVFHDVVLHHLLETALLYLSDDPDRYREALRQDHGEAGVRLSRLERIGVSGDLEDFLFPLIGHVARRGSRLVAHSRYAADRLAEAAPDVPLVVIPHHAGSPPPEVALVGRSEARARLGLPTDAFIVGAFGLLTQAKQPEAVIAGFGRLHREIAASMLLVVGEDATGGLVERAAREAGVEGAMRVTGFASPIEFHLSLRAVDAVVALRYPTAGETSGVVIRALSEGRPVIANRYGAFAELPDDAVLKVEVDGPQAEQVGFHLVRLARDPSLRGRVEARARVYAARELDPARCAERYVAAAAA